MAGPKGYGLAMMVDILSGSLLGLPFGKHVTSMYKDLSEYRRLGQLHLVINPEYFGGKEQFLEKYLKWLKNYMTTHLLKDLTKCIIPVKFK